jgi:hypothetical protein
MENKFWILVFSLALYGCQQSFTNAEFDEFAAEETNGYRYTKSVNGVDFTLIYKPTDVMLRQELGDSVNLQQIESLRKKYSNNLYFSLAMSKNDQELLNEAVRDRNKYNEMVNKLVFTMDQSIHFVSKNRDTMPMIDFNYPRMYGMAKSTSMLIVFPRDEKFIDQEYSDFIVEDIGMGTGDVKFRIKNKIFRSEPVIH